MIRIGRTFCFVALVVLISACGGSSPSTGGRTVEVSITDAGCDPFELTLAKGATTFHVKNNGADSITEFEVLDSSNKIVGEKENLTPGLDGRFSIDLVVGQYTLACPGGSQHPTGKLTVTDTGAAAHDHSTGASEDATACVPSGSSDSPTGHVNAALSDFKIELDNNSVPAGTIALDGTNNGTHPHEMVIVKGIASSALPTEADGAVDEDKIADDASIGEVEAFNSGLACSGAFALTAGTYTIFCNVDGAEGSHFKKGMVTTITVT